jgi:hypothetical protein
VYCSQGAKSTIEKERILALSILCGLSAPIHIITWLSIQNIFAQHGSQYHEAGRLS